MGAAGWPPAALTRGGAACVAGGGGAISVLRALRLFRVFKASRRVACRVYGSPLLPACASHGFFFRVFKAGRTTRAA
jgi:hypothetical protein